MLSADEGKGWQQLGEAMMPNPGHDASVMMDGFSKIGDRALNSIFGGTSLPDLHDALGAMFGPQPIELHSALPSLELFDSASESFKDASVTDRSANLSDASSPFANIGKAFNEIISKMGDVIGSLTQGPMGLLSGLLNFLLTVFSEIVTAIGQAVEETAKAAASLAAEVWKKQLQMST